MATTLTISTPVTTTLTIDGVTTNYNISGENTTLEISTSLSSQLASGINYTPSGRMAATTVQTALDEIAGDFFVQDGTPSGSQLNEGDLWYDTDDDELKVYRGTTWQTLAGAGGDAETMLTLDGGSF
jgi:hypothetical protein